MNKPLSNNLQNIDMNKTAKLVYVLLMKWRKTHFDKTTFKDMHCN